MSTIDLTQGTLAGTSTSAAEGAWRQAFAPIGLRVNSNGSAIGPTAGGLVRHHEVSVIPIGSPRHTNGVRTQYTVRFNAPHAPQFSLTKRRTNSRGLVPTGNPGFDASVSVDTEDPLGFSRFMTERRRLLVERLVGQWPTAEIDRAQIRLWTDGLESTPARLSETVNAMVATAEAMSRPVTGEVGTDAGYVLSSLFNSNLDVEEITEQFDLLFRDRPVTWSGEVLQVGAVDKAGQRIAVLIGSANGEDADSGRVVALTVVDPSTDVDRGDVVEVEGSLLNLDAKKRLFRIE